MSDIHGFRPFGRVAWASIVLALTAFACSNDPAWCRQPGLFLPSPPNRAISNRFLSLSLLKEIWVTHFVRNTSQISRPFLAPPSSSSHEHVYTGLLPPLFFGKREKHRPPLSPEPRIFPSSPELRSFPMACCIAIMMSHSSVCPRLPIRKANCPRRDC